MKSKILRRLPITGFVLFIASTIAATMVPKDDIKKVNNGTLIATSDGGELTCQAKEQADSCTHTATLAQGVVGNRGVGSRTSTNNSASQNDSSSITISSGFFTINSLTEGADNIYREDLHTSFDGA